MHTKTKICGILIGIFIGLTITMSSLWFVWWFGLLVSFGFAGLGAGIILTSNYLKDDLIKHQKTEQL